MRPILILALCGAAFGQVPAPSSGNGGGSGGSGSGNNTYCADATGSTTTYTCPVPTPTITTLTGLIVTFVPQTTNTGTSTLNVAALGGKTLKQADCSTNVASGALIGGTAYLFSYNGTSLCQSSSSSSVSSAIGSGTPVTVSANSTSAQQLMELSVTAALLNVLNQPFDIHASGKYSTALAQTPTLTFTAKLCTVSGCGSGTAITLASIVSGNTLASIVNNTWLFDLSMITTAAGASGTLTTKGKIVIDLGALGTAADTVYSDTNTATSSAIDLTAALFLNFSVTTSTGNVGNSITQMIGTIQPGSAAGPTGPIGPAGSGGSVFTGSTALTSAFSATPTFSLADVSVKSPIRFEPGALTANVTAVTFTGKSAGATFYIAWLQDGTGGRTVAYGASASGALCAVSPTAGITTTQRLQVSADGTTVVGLGCTTNDAWQGLSAVEGTCVAGVAGSDTLCADSTAHAFKVTNNGGSAQWAVVSSAAPPADATKYLDGTGAYSVPPGSGGGFSYFQNNFNGNSIGNVAAGVTTGCTLYGTGPSCSVPFATSMNLPAKTSGNVKNLCLTIFDAQPGTGTLVATLFINNAGTALVATIAAGGAAQTVCDTTHTVSYVANDLLRISITNNAATASGSLTGFSGQIQ